MFPDGKWGLEVPVLLKLVCTVLRGRGDKGAYEKGLFRFFFFLAMPRSLWYPIVVP